MPGQQRKLDQLKVIYTTSSKIRRKEPSIPSASLFLVQNCCNGCQEKNVCEIPSPFSLTSFRMIFYSNPLHRQLSLYLRYSFSPWSCNCRHLHTLKGCVFMMQGLWNQLRGWSLKYFCFLVMWQYMQAASRTDRNSFTAYTVDQRFPDLVDVTRKLDVHAETKNWNELRWVHICALNFPHRLFKKSILQFKSSLSHNRKVLLSH